MDEMMIFIMFLYDDSYLFMDEETKAIKKITARSHNY